MFENAYFYISKTRVPRLSEQSRHKLIMELFFPLYSTCSTWFSRVKTGGKQMTGFSFAPREAPKSQGSHFDQAECLQAPLTCLVKR